MKRQSARTLEDVEIHYVTPMAAALHELCVDRFHRSIQRSGSAFDGADLPRHPLSVALIAAQRELDAEAERMKALVSAHSVSDAFTFIKPKAQFVRPTKTAIWIMLDVLARFDELVRYAFIAYLSGLLPGEDMDRKLDKYQTRLMEIARQCA